MRNPATLYQASEAAPDEQVVAILPVAQPVGHLYISDSSKTVRVDTVQLSPTEVSFMAPEGLAFGPISVSTADGPSPAPPLSGQLNLVQVVPGIYSANGDGAGVAKAAWSFAGASISAYTNCNGSAMSCLPQPVPAGATLQLQGTGFRSAAQLQAFVGGLAATVISFGAYGSVDQVTLTVPNSLTGAGNSSVYIVADGNVSNMTSIEIQ